MTSKAPKLRLDALGAIASAREFVDGVSLAQYATDKMRRSAVERQLEILGYDAVDDEIVYLTVTEDLAELELALACLPDGSRNAN
jgi:uncharacterized protein with HEPN domain